MRVPQAHFLTGAGWLAHANTSRFEWLQWLVLSKSTRRRKPQTREPISRIELVDKVVCSIDFEHHASAIRQQEEEVHTLPAEARAVSQ
ncbi:hypothetical protein AYJ54_36095 [Bradyrhizobium centrolobii]|uniref:Uncharacterized protein n=2 Tax=Bradyrhizobium TaxID=374 RepID=A0A176Z1S0_9BRAD|nr:hypothetical protein AYJ54_36095 [Bradyrhizobium centrolobii]OAF13140.1 hypothetical protein AXW67_18860 [Bradyrhizobium neotropicale]